MEELGKSSSADKRTKEVRGLKSDRFESKADLRVPSDQDVDMEETESEDAQSDNERPYDYQPEENELPELPLEGFQRDHSLIDIDFCDKTRPASPLSAGLKQHNPANFSIDPQLLSPPDSGGQPIPSSPSDLVPYDPNLRMDVLTNEALLSMVQAWQYIAQDEGGANSLKHRHFRCVMEELWSRGIVDENGTWIVNVKSVNMCWRRVIV